MGLADAVDEACLNEATRLGICDRARKHSVALGQNRRPGQVQPSSIISGRRPLRYQGRSMSAQRFEANPEAIPSCFRILL